MIERIPRSGELPLSFNQDVQLLADWLARIKGARAVPLHPAFAFRLDRDPDVPALETALNEIVQRHEVLRTAFSDVSALSAAETYEVSRRLHHKTVLESSLFRQRIHDAAPLRVSQRHTTVDANDESALSALLDEAARAPFDLSVPPLVRATLVTCRGGERILLLVLHHLVCDRWSVRVLLSELEALYARRADGRADLELPHLPIQYADFAAWQRRQVATGAWDRMIDYWTELWTTFLPDRVSASDLPCARPAPREPTFAVATERLDVDAPTGRAIRAFCRQARVTPHMLWLSAVVGVLHLYHGKTKVALFGNFANRTQLETEHLIGWFANSYLFGVRVSPDAPASTLLEQVRHSALAAQSCQAVPLGALWGRFMKEGRLHDVSVEEWIAFEFVAAPERQQGGHIERLTHRPVRVSPSMMRATLRLLVADVGDGFRLSCTHSRDRFSTDDVLHMLRDLHALAVHLTVASADRLEACAHVIRTPRKAPSC